VQTARGRILLMPCGGINWENLLRVVRTTLAQEIHTSVGASRSDPTGSGNGWSDGKDAADALPPPAIFEGEVATLVTLLGGVSQGEWVS
jgi:copper homeostasis protein CutC